VLDLVTTFGTMVCRRSPGSRPRGFDLIVDFTFTGILLIPQLLAWVIASKHAKRRAVPMWLLFIPVTFAIRRECAYCRRADCQNAIWWRSSFFRAVLLPAFRGWGSN